MKVTNSKQFEMLVEELRKNPPLAKGFKRGISPSDFKDSWAAISTKLNSLGPPSRDSDGWQKVWRDLKFNVKRKMVHNKAEANATGGGRNKQIPMSLIDEAVASLLDLDRQVNPGGRFVGITVSENELIIEESPENFETIESIEESAPKPSRNKKRSKENLFEKHEMQKTAFNNVFSSLQSIKCQLKDISYYSRKQLKLSQRKAQREEELFEIEREIKKKKLEALDRQLQLYG